MSLFKSLTKYFTNDDETSLEVVSMDNNNPTHAIMRGLHPITDEKAIEIQDKILSAVFTNDGE